MNDEDKIYAICWLDSGKFSPQSVAERFGMSVYNLEADLVAFKHHTDYINIYADYVYKEIAAALVDCRFPAWDGNCTLRVLGNQRLECLWRIPEGDKYYHFYIPDKSYLDDICKVSRWVSEHSFCEELGNMGINDWKALPAQEQFKFLAQRYDSDIFDPFCIRTDRAHVYSLLDEYMPGDASWSLPATQRQYHGYASMNGSEDRKKMNSDLSLLEQERRNNEITQLVKWIGNGEFNYEYDHQELHCELDENDRNAIFSILMESDSRRLQTLAAKGPCTIEKDILFKIDPFYKYYDLDGLMGEGLKSNDWSTVKHKAQEAFGRISEAYRKRQPEAKPAVANPSQSVIPASKLHKSDNVLHDLFWRLLHEICEASTPDELSESVDALRAEVEKSGTSGKSSAAEIYRQEFLNIMSEGVRSMIEQVLEMPSGNREETVQKSEPVVPVADGQPAESEGLREQRSKLLADISAQGMVPELVKAFAETERRILLIPTNRRPTFYPEKDFTLCKLYLLGFVPTEIAVIQTVTADLTPAQVNDIFKL